MNVRDWQENAPPPNDHHFEDPIEPEVVALLSEESFERALGVDAA